MKPDQATPALRLLGPPTVVADAAALDEAGRELNFELPASYRAFAATYGYGRLCGLFLVYIPVKMPSGSEHPSSLAVRCEELSRVFEDGIEGGLFEYEPDGSEELISRLVPFGISENGHYLAWDPEERTGPAEHRIYVVGPKLLAVWKGPGTLGEFIRACGDARVKGVLGSGYEPLPGTFEPLEPYYGDE